jgi:hypothetical protein
MDTIADDKNGPSTAEQDQDQGTAGGEPSSLVDAGSEGPTSLQLAVGPPSPLTGSYLLIVIGEPYSQEHKDIILQKLLKGEQCRYLKNIMLTFTTIIAAVSCNEVILHYGKYVIIIIF